MLAGLRRDRTYSWCPRCCAGRSRKWSAGPQIKRIHTHGEKAAAYMADGYARASGRPGVCMAQVVGALNLAAGLRDAWLAHSPVIAFTGGRDPHTKFRQVYQEVDDVPAFEPVTKFNATVDAVERFPGHGAPGVPRRGVRHARAGAPAVPRQRGPDRPGRSGDGAAVRRRSSRACRRSAPNRRCSTCIAALDVLQKAERPVIVAGGGVRASGAARELVALAEKLGIPVATSLNGKDSIPGTSSAVGGRGRHLFARERQPRRRAGRPGLLHRHRGRRHDDAFLGRAEDRRARRSRSTSTPKRSGRNYPLKAAVLGDAKTVLARMLEHADAATAARAQALARSGARPSAGKWRAKYRPLLESDAVPIRPERICAELTRHVPDDAIVVVDTGHAGMWMGGMFDLRSPKQSYIRSAGHLGWAFPAGLGAKCASPGAAGRRVHRRRRVLVPHRRNRNRGALEDQHRHRRQQQRRRQSVQARLRPRLRRRADRAGPRAVDVQPGRTSRASPRTWARSASASRSRPTSPRRSSGRCAPTGRSSSTSSPTSRCSRRSAVSE